MANTGNSSVVVTEAYIEALTRRVDALEKKLLSQERTPPVIPLKTAVKELERKLELLASREKSGDAKQLWEKMQQLERVVSPEYLQSLEMTEAVKAELLCSQVEQLKNFSERMEEVKL